jgi:DNA primase
MQSAPESEYQRWQRKVTRAQQVPILDVAAHFGHGPLQDAGRGELKMRCPFHRSFDQALLVNPEKNVWYCWKCGGGGPIRLYRCGTGRHFREAVIEMLEVFGA